MFDFITATDVINQTRAMVENYFNKHPEYDLLLKNIDKAIQSNSMRLLRLDNGLQIAFDDEESEDFYLQDYVKLQTVPVEEVKKERKPVYKTSFTGKQVIDYYEEVEVHTQKTITEVDEDEVVLLGKYIVALFKLNGFACTCQYKDGDFSNGRLISIRINVGGTANEP